MINFLIYFFFKLYYTVKAGNQKWNAVMQRKQNDQTEIKPNNNKKPAKKYN